MSPAFTETREQVTRGRVSLALPATAADLNEALAALDRRGVNAADVKVAIVAPFTVLEMAYESVETLGAPTKSIPVDKMPTWKTPSTTPAPMPMYPSPLAPNFPALPTFGQGIIVTNDTSDTRLDAGTLAIGTINSTIDGAKIKQGSITADKLAPASELDVKRAEKESGKTPFPTSLGERLPELTISTAHRLLEQPSGTYLLHLPVTASTKEAQKLVQRVHTAAKSFRHRTGAEALVETKRDRDNNALAVTILKADTPTG